MLKNKKPDKKSQDGRFVISSEIYMTKNTDETGTEKNKYYLRRSIKDYFINIDESEIDETDLLNVINSQHDSLIKMITVEVEFKKYKEIKNDDYIVVWNIQ